MKKTTLKIFLGFLIIVLLGTSTLLVTALMQSPLADTDKNNKNLQLLNSEDEEEDIDEDDLTQEEIYNLDKKITEKEAVNIALKEVSGTVTDIELERKRGHEVYSVEIDDNGEEVDVFVDIKTGEVIGTERDSEELEEDED